MSSFNINLHEVTYSLSDALDLVGVTHIHHGKRVAYMAAECGVQLGWSGERLDDLYQAAILHDVGVSTTYVHSRLRQLEWESEDGHCEIGATLLKSCSLLAKFSDTVRYHHTHWSELQKLDLPPDVKLSANCIFMVDRVDMLALAAFKEHANILRGMQAIRQAILDREEHWFCPELVHAFSQVSRSEAFWLCLERDQIDGYTSRWISHDQYRDVEFTELRNLVHVFSGIVDAKSPYTREHSDGVGRLSRLIGQLFELPERNCEMLELAGLLHDLGKLRVPDELLEKPGKLTADEFAALKRHSFDSFCILRTIRGLQEIAVWASQHHERSDGFGYPYHLTSKALSLEARIIAVADVFQALAQQRPYRDELLPGQILKTLKQEVSNGHLDEEIVARVEHHLVECWTAAVEQPKVNQLI